MIALIEAARAGLFAKKYISQNILAGIIVGIISIPLSMAFAIASHVKPEFGLYTTIIAAFCGSVFGGSLIQISGPTGAFIGILVSISTQFGHDGLQIATIMAGCIMIIMGISKFGKMIKFIPEQVIIGFTTGIAVNLFIGQIPNFFGLSCGRLSVNFFEKISQIANATPTVSTHTTVIAIISLLILIFSKKTCLKAIPGPMLALIFGIVFQYAFKFKSVATIGNTFGGIPNILPTPCLPTNISLPRIASLFSSAFTIALLCSIESLLSAVIGDRISNTKHSSSQELIGQGISNIVAPLFGGIASTGAISRTAASVRAGGNSPLAGIISALSLVIIIWFCAPLANNIPLATLSAIIFMVAYNMGFTGAFSSLIAHAPKSDAVILIITFLLTVLCGIITAVNVGVILSSLILMYRLSSSTNIDREIYDVTALGHNLSALPKEISVYTVSGPLFFGMIDKLENVIHGINNDVKILILRMKNVPFIDTSGLQELHTMIKEFKANGRKIIFAEIQEIVAQKLCRSEISDSTGQKPHNLPFDNAITFAKQLLNNTPNMK